MYRDMFLLDDAELTGGPILDCPGGASSFGAEVRALGGEVVSVDPAYAAPTEVVAHALADADLVAAWQRSNPAGFDWSYLGSAGRVQRTWWASIARFAADFAPDGTRYVPAALPDLPFPDGRFALTISGFLLFVYPEVLGFDDHRDGLLELVRVTRGEVRIYPVHDTAGAPYPHLPELRAVLRASGVATELRSTGTSWSSRPGSDRMLVCRRSGGGGGAGSRRRGEAAAGLGAWRSTSSTRPVWPTRAS
jgi:hypothetical protein